MNTIAPEDLKLIASAKSVLESESLALKISRIAGRPVDALLKGLPRPASQALNLVTHATLEKASLWAMATTGSKADPVLREDRLHRLAVIATGIVGGMGGLPSTLAELPISTFLMLRSMGCIAEQEGHDMRERKTRLACVSVLAMGADPEKVQADELSYWAVRKVMAGFVTQAAEWGGRGAMPPLAKFIMEVGKRFGIGLSAKAAAQLAPVAGATAGGILNNVFMDHYQTTAHAHFCIERLCRSYGEEAVRDAYREA